MICSRGTGTRVRNAASYALTFRARWEQKLQIVRRRHLDKPIAVGRRLRATIRTFGRRLRRLPKGQLDLFRPE